MKRILMIAGSGIIVLLCGAFIGLRIWIGQDVKENIKIVNQQYEGTTEDALISFLMDENNSAYDRTHIAIWTLGQIHSEKALPFLYDYYRDDPEGKICYGRHDSLLCQYEIHKAIVSIEKGRLFSYARFK